MSGASPRGRRVLAAVDPRSQHDSVQVDRDWLEAVGMRVRLARTARRESQNDLSRRARVSRVTVGSIERGDHPASVLAYARLAVALGLPLGDLLDGYGRPAAGDAAGRVR